MTLHREPRPRPDLLKGRLIEAAEKRLFELGVDTSQSKLALEAIEPIASLAAAMTSAMSRNGELRDLLGVFASTLYEEARARRALHDMLRWPEVLVAEAEPLLDEHHKLAQLGDAPHAKTVLETFAESISALLVHGCRVRIYSIDLTAARYQGLASIGMDHDFDESFTNRKEIPLLEPPYSEVGGTLCVMLAAGKVAESLSHDRTPEYTWYRDILGLGTIVPETYTWHFTKTGCLPYSVVRSSAPPSPTMWAFSIDAGGNHRQYDERRLTLPQLRVIDALLRGSVGKSLARGVVNVIDGHCETAEKRDASEKYATRSPDVTPHFSDGSILASEEPTAPVINDCPAMPPQAMSACGKNTDSATKEPNAPLVGTSSPPTLIGSFDCLPGKRPWVFSPVCEAATPVAKVWDELCNLVGPTGCLFQGPTGSGKNELLKSVYEVSRKLRGQYVSASLGEGTFTLVNLKGAGPGHYTGQEGNATHEGDTRRNGRASNHKDGQRGAVLSVFQRAKEGVVVFSDLVTAIKEGRKVADFLDVVWNAIVGDPVEREHDGKKWINKSIVAATGPEDSEEILRRSNPDLLGRFEPVVTVPGWKDLCESSRKAIFRWHLLMLAKKYKAERVRVSREVYDWMVNDAKGQFATTNMRGVYKRFTQGCRPRVLEDQDGEWLELTADSFSNYPVDLPKESSGWLELGTVEFEKRLDPFEKLILAIARCARSDSHDCISGLHPSWETTLSEKMQDPVGALNSYYLLAAAGSLHSAEDSNDLYGIRPKTHQCHLPNGRNYVVQKLLGDHCSLTASDFRGPGNSAVPGSGHSGPNFYKLARHARQYARELQQVVERIACAYPPFFHVVPLWDQTWESAKLLQSRSNPNQSATGADVGDG